MSLNGVLSAGVTTILTNSAALRVTADNIANVNTAGFKADREFYSLFLGLEAEVNIVGDVTWMPVVEGSVIDLRQGLLTPTGAPLDQWRAKQMWRVFNEGLAFEKKSEACRLAWWIVWRRRCSVTACSRGMRWPSVP